MNITEENQLIEKINNFKSALYILKEFEFNNNISIVETFLENIEKKLILLFIYFNKKCYNYLQYWFLYGYELYLYYKDLNIYINSFEPSKYEICVLKILDNIDKYELSIYGKYLNGVKMV